MPASRRASGAVIAWMPVSQRSSTIATRLGYELFLIGRRGFRSPWTAPLEYPVAAVRTVAFLARRRPRAIVVIAPPFVAPLVVAPVAAMLRAPFVIDVHTGALRDRRWRWSTRILRALGRIAAASVVTLASLGRELEAPGARVLVAPDPLPDLAPPAEVHPRAGDGPPLVVGICGWGDDEPVDALVASANGQPWNLVLTGRPRWPVRLPPNARLSGFLGITDYVRLLSSADVIVVLTTRDDTLLSGGWEALALGRPVVVSGTPALRETFGDAIRYAGDDAASIAAAIGGTLGDADAAERSRALAATFRAANDAALGQVAEALGTRLDRLDR